MKFMERILHYVWKYGLYGASPLCTTEGLPLSVIDPGIENRDAGPDFFNAKIRIADTLWAGSVEIHDRASDWMRHHHDQDKAYDGVILHVVGVADADVVRTNGEPIPMLQLPVSSGCPSECGVVALERVAGILPSSSFGGGSCAYHRLVRCVVD